MSNKHINALQKAKENINSGENLFICTALGSSEISEEIREEINLSLCGFNTVSNWLRFKGIDTGLDNSPEMREYRLAWIDQMIEYWKDKK